MARRLGFDARMIEGSCHCGAVRLEVASAPVELTSCACSICSRTGALLTYHPLKDVRITGATDVYMWGDRMIEFHRCKTCGCFTHWLPVDKDYDRMGVNARMMPREIWSVARVRYTPGPD